MTIGRVHYNLTLTDILFHNAPPFLMCVSVGGGGYRITLVRTSRLVRTKNGFRAISFENIGVLDSYFIHRYIIIKHRSSSIKDITRVMALGLRIGFPAIYYELIDGN